VRYDIHLAPLRDNAAHCVGTSAANGNHYAPSTLYPQEVDQILTPNLNLLSVINASSVSGAWPNWSVSTLGAADGYIKTPMTCYVAYRCAQIDGPNPIPNCGPGTSFGAAAGSDIALMYCPGRTATSYVTVNTGNPTSGSILVNWFHEVLDLDIAPNTGLPPHTPQANWFNYGFYDGTTANNYHYTNSANSNALPLQSAAFPNNGANYKITGSVGTVGTSGSGSYTDAIACHGTSGSGVFMNGTTTLLGPALQNGDGSLWTNRLCADAFNAASTTPGQKNMNFGGAAVTRALESLSIIAADR
jgi:hypothetical protein